MKNTHGTITIGPIASKTSGNELLEVLDYKFIKWSLRNAKPNVTCIGSTEDGMPLYFYEISGPDVEALLDTYNVPVYPEEIAMALQALEQRQDKISYIARHFQNGELVERNFRMHHCKQQGHYVWRYEFCDGYSRVPRKSSENIITTFRPRAVAS